MRRLTTSQYIESVRDAFGEDLELAGRLEPDLRREHLLAVGTAYVTVTSTGLEQYEDMAYRIAAQVLDADRRARTVPCTPADDARPDDECAATFVRQVGKRLFRRPLTPDEVTARILLADQATTTLGDFYEGLEFALASLLTSPHFLFRIPTVEADETGATRLTDYAMASRLSYALWNSAPDEALLDAAAEGTLTDPDGLAQHIQRMIDSDRLAQGLRALFTDLLAFDRFDDGFRKDGAVYPAYVPTLMKEAREQTLLTVVADSLSGGDYRALFTTRRTFLTRRLGALYGVPIGATDGFEAYTFPAAHPRSGLLTHAGILALHSHPGRSSATLRGAFVRLAFLCQPVPPPPGDVDFSLVEAPDPTRPTLRDRVEAHMSNPGCVGCHSLTDPIGLALEQYDGLGSYREAENGAEIDPSGELDGTPFDDAAGLGAALAAHPGLVRCLVKTVFQSVVGRAITPEEVPELDRLEAAFIDAGHRLPALWSAVLGSPAVRWTTGPMEAQP